MNKICLSLLLSILFFACKKEQRSASSNPTIVADSLAKYFHPGKTDSLDIIANWELIASRVRFSVGHPDTNWVLANINNATTIIGFMADKVFSFNDNYAWKDQLYNRYRTIAKNELNADSANFRIYATILPTGNIGIYQSVTVKLLNRDALLISYMSTDISKQELYIRSGSGTIHY